MSMTSPQKLVSQGGTPVRTDPWPEWPVWSEEDAQAVADVVRSGQWFAGTGTQCREFADQWARLHDARYAVPCTNGTHALEIALRATGIQAGDEVITTPYTFIATGAACVQINAVPIFADVDLATFNLDPAAVEAAVTERTRAIIAVHIAGNPADLDALGDIARRKNLVLIEDAAQAHLAEWRERKVGAIGQVGTFSFQASKNLNSGEGGVVTTDDEETYEQAWSLVNCGRVREGGWYEHRMLSGNFRLTEFQAALLLSQMRRLPEQTRLRNENAQYLAGILAEIEGIQPLNRDERVTSHAYHKFIFRYQAPAFGGLPRPEFLKALQSEGIPCHPGYEPMYRSPAFKINAATHPFAGRIDYSQLRLPGVEQACSEAVWLDQRMFLTSRKDMDDVAAAILKIQAAVRG
jgi:dTDP-4-amino-4,6-dideoxygalactose transaminase